ncbi:MAG TPA: TylF/MycF/NovP-related O-methyltransferase [Bacillota bacterium]|nr:TylF/MycF/NovP-related O-methyltransferase [Bacillota bacterium]
MQDFITQTLQRHAPVSDQVSRADIALILRELDAVLRQAVPGGIVELGCYVGTTSLFIRRLLDHHHQSDKREFHAYDSFAGLPDKVAQDQSAAGVDFRLGELTVSKKDFLQQFRSSNLRPPIIHKGWFNELTPADVPDQIAFAFLDGDFYESILDSLRLVWPRMTAGSTLLIDDYQREALPGVERAVRDFFRGKPMPPLRQMQNIAIVHL